MKRLVQLPAVSSSRSRSQPSAQQRIENGEEGHAKSGWETIVSQVLEVDSSGILQGSSLADASNYATEGGWVSELRQLLCAEIARCWPKNKAKAQAASNLLDHSNRLFIAYERSSGAATSSARSASHSETDTFWDLPQPEWQDLLLLTAERGPGPATLPLELASGRRRHDIGGLRGQRARQHEWQVLSKSRFRHAPHLSTAMQQQLAFFLESTIEATKGTEAVDWRETFSLLQIHNQLDMSEGTPAQVIIQSLDTQQHVETLQKGVVGDALLVLPLEFSVVCEKLRKGQLSSLPTVVEGVVEACHEAGVEHGFGNAHIKESILEQADVLAAELAEALKEITTTLHKNGVIASKFLEEPDVLLPESIQANREAYAQGEWRKQAFAARPYEHLKQFYFEEDKNIISWKLTTQKKVSCDGKHCTEPGQLGHYSLEKEAFQTECECLSNNAECSSTCGCKTLKCLNSAIQRRDVLKLGIDVLEQPSWGMDCYTRRNIQDAVLESQAFGPYKQPDYKALLAKNNASVLKAGETLQHNITGCDALNAQPQAGEGPSEAPPDQPLQPGGVLEQVTNWHEKSLLPAINLQGDKAWDLQQALDMLKETDAGSASAVAAEAVSARLKQVGGNYFRVHPKGIGVVCLRDEGLSPLTFVDEYLGEVHTPSRWYEIQDALKKTTNDELPDFYNIQLERPKDDPGGYDCLFVDAASKGAFVSRMSHSCTPNCQAVMMTAGKRLTIAVYTLRHINKGEELTFDYSSVTESEKEFKAAVCLCGTSACRGSFLYFAGSKAFMQVLASHHGMFARQIMILRAGSESLTDEDKARLERFGMRDCALSFGPGLGRAPEWLQKWVSLALEYVELEQSLLPAQLLAIPPPLGNFTAETAASQAKGVSDNRLQNAVFTLDKIKLCLRRPGQPQEAPLTMLSSKEIIEFLWTGHRSIAKRVLRAAAPGLSNVTTGLMVAEADTMEELKAALRKAATYPKLLKLGRLTMAKVKSVEDASHALVTELKQDSGQFKLVVNAKANVLQLAKVLRAWDREAGAVHSAIADLLLLYGNTTNWFQALRDYKGFMSSPLNIDIENINLDRTTGPLSVSMENLKSAEQFGEPGSLQLHANGSSKRILEEKRTEAQPNKRAKLNEAEHCETLLLSDDTVNANGAHAEDDAAIVEMDEDTGNALEGKATVQRTQGVLCKKYGPWFVWGQLNAWYKQTVYDPSASLSAERRGTISLPDIECAFVGHKSKYTSKERENLLEQLEKRPDSSWRSNSMWTFRNDAKIYGSPMFDAAWSQLKNSHNPLPEVIKAFREHGGD